MVFRYFAGDKTKTHAATWRRLSDGYIRVAANGTFVAPVVADWEDYQHVLSQEPANSGRFKVAVPAGLADGSYAVEIAVRTNPAEGSVDDLVFLIDPDARVLGGEFADELAAILAIPTAGTGPLTRTITVQDSGNTPIVGAVVAMTGGFSGTTNASGQVQFHHNAGTFTITAAKSGYAGASSGAVNLTATGSTTLTLTATGVTPSATPGQTTGYFTVRDGGGTPLGGVRIAFRLVDPFPAADDVEIDAWKRQNRYATSSSNPGDLGLAQITLLKGGKYQAKWADKGDADWSEEFTVPTNAGATFSLPKVLGPFGS